MSSRLTLIKVRRVPDDNVNHELQWLGNSLGLFNLRDRDSSCFRVFITLVKRSKKQEPISSDEIADQLSLSRGTVVHHLIKLMDSGMVMHERKGYLLKEATLQKVVKDVRREMEQLFAEMEEVAKEIDERMG